MKPLNLGQFPETFKWFDLDGARSGMTYELADRISAIINEDLKTVDRNFTPGLRQALRILAEVYEDSNKD
jgi:hypothetical protein